MISDNFLSWLTTFQNHSCLTFCEADEVTIKKAFKSGQVRYAEGYCPNGDDLSR